MVFEATYLVAVLTPGHMSACCGQYGAQMSKVLRPNNRSNGMFICFLMAVPRTSSEYGLIHPPYAKPPLVSSSGPPGACMTPSREINSSTITFLMTEFLRVLSDLSNLRRTRSVSGVAVALSGRHRRQCCHCRSVASVGPHKRAHLDFNTDPRLSNRCVGQTLTDEPGCRVPKLHKTRETRSLPTHHLPRRWEDGLAVCLHHHVTPGRHHSSKVWARTWTELT